MLELIVALPDDSVQFVEEYQIELHRAYEQSLELYAHIYIIQAHRFIDLYNETGTPVYLKLAMANQDRYLELTEAE